MKDVKIWATFLAGATAGILALLVVQCSIGMANKNYKLYDDDELGEVIEAKSFKVESAVENNIFFVRLADIPSYESQKYVMIDKKGRLYDDKIINVPNGKVARVIGVYRYKEFEVPFFDVGEENLPIIGFVDK